MFSRPFSRVLILLLILGSDKNNAYSDTDPHEKCDVALARKVSQQEIEAALTSDKRSLVILDSGAMVEGKLKAVQTDVTGTVSYLQFEGPTRLLRDGSEIEGQGTKQHPSGFGSPVGVLEDGKNLAITTKSELKKRGIVAGKEVTLTYRSGVVVHGTVLAIQWGSFGPIVITFSDCLVTNGGDILYQPSWGTFDMVIGGGITLKTGVFH